MCRIMSKFIFNLMFNVVECMNVRIKDVFTRSKAGDAKAMEDILLRFDRLIRKVSMDHGVVDEEIAQEVRAECLIKQ